MLDIIPQDTTPLKQCTKCKKFWPATLEYFSKQNTVFSGLRSMCKECNKAYDATRAALKNERKKELRRSNPEAAERMRLQDRLAIKRNAVTIRRRKKRYYDDHPEQRIVEANRRRARERSVPGTHTAAQIAEQLKRQDHKCYYAACGFSKFPRVKENGKWKYDYVVEHTFPLARVVGTDIPANDMSYIVLSCKSCNGKKGKKLPHEWFEGGRLL